MQLFVRSGVKMEGRRGYVGLFCRQSCAVAHYLRGDNSGQHFSPDAWLFVSGLSLWISIFLDIQGPPDYIEFEKKSAGAVNAENREIGVKPCGPATVIGKRFWPE